MSSASYTGGYTYLPQGQTTYSSDLCHNLLPDLTVAINRTVYAIQAYGGFQTSRTFDNITRLPETLIAQFDVTGAVEVVIPTSVFNAKIGIVKHNGVVDNNASVDYYDICTNMLKTDNLSLSPVEFVTCCSAANSVISVGTFSTIYSDFTLYVAQYFGFSGGNFPEGSEWGFGTLFSGELQFAGAQGNYGLFDSAAFVNLLRYSGNALTLTASGGEIPALSGGIQVAGITQLLRNAVDSDPFGNRNSTSFYPASDMHDHRDYGVTDGFYPDDLLFIPTNGFQITLNLGIDNESFSNPLNNINNPTNQSNNFLANDASGSTTVGSAITGSQTASISTSRTVSQTLLQRIVVAPLLIRLGATLNIDTSANFSGGLPSMIVYPPVNPPYYPAPLA